MKSIKRSPSEKSASFLLFVFGWMLLFFNFPILSIFNLSEFVGGIPLLYAYIFLIWLGFILVLFCVVQDTNREE